MTCGKTLAQEKTNCEPSARKKPAGLTDHVVQLINAHVVQLINAHVVRLINAHAQTLYSQLARTRASTLTWFNFVKPYVGLHDRL